MVLSEESVGAFCFVLTTKVTSPPPPPQNPWVGAFFAIAFLAPNGSLCLMWKRQLVRAGRSRSCYEHCTNGTGTATALRGQERKHVSASRARL